MALREKEKSPRDLSTLLSDTLKTEEELDQATIDLARVTRVMAGGKRMRFRAAVAVGDHKGQIGFAVAKGADVSGAISKAARLAKKHAIRISIVNTTIPHMVEKKFKAAHILLKPASKGHGIKAGGVMRSILELSGIENVTGKMLGSGNKINNAKATLEALHMLKGKREMV